MGIGLVAEALLFMRSPSAIWQNESFARMNENGKN